MIKISNNGIITMTKGDDVSVPFFINQGTPIRQIRYSLLSNPNSELYLGVMMPYQDFENALVRKKFTHDSPHTQQRDVIVSFTPQDTQCLMPGRYYIEAKLRVFDKYGNERIFTVMPKKIFQLEE